jgi:predicted transcriptional regulator
MSDDLESTTLAQRIVLCSLTELSPARTPANSAEIREVATKHLGAADIDSVGSFTEADVMRALNALVESEFVDEQRPDDRSPVGKGRPEYSLSEDTDTVQAELRDDERLAPLLE